MLKSVLAANAMSCLVFGLIFVLVPAGSANFIGDPPELLIRILGLGLLGNAVLLALTAQRRQFRRVDILAFAFGDAIWVIVTILLLVSGIWILTVHGQVAATAVAMFVGACGWLQWKHAPHRD